MASMRGREYLSFAKINLFLHVLDKRDDGYHNLQTWFQFIDLKDRLYFEFNNSNLITIKSNKTISSEKDNLVYKAIRLFQETYAISAIGLDVFIEKNIPMGAGLGGGSSNAAVTLMAMRDKYRPDISNADMLDLGKKLGADVPIFLFGKSAWAEGIGEKLFSKNYKEQYALLIKPDIHISTKEFFNSQYLVKHESLISRELDLDRRVMKNDFEVVFLKMFPEFKNRLSVAEAQFYMTGTGSCFYVLSDNKYQLEKVATKIDKDLDKWLVKTLNYVY
ncbi:4-(cytidine 5'-diphospho)-2-C-methyl-D-erythritol kinase [Pseudofrancisella aestuarii]|uniref:4-diphosphocytidyl-2-C-methyl-D-erythritol kinase n=1 Tax=Pseudofrancisella aestuarii TaxID=2670347 RepID=A0ABV9TBW2_9GAMM|nr:4-(cytidine 5'-diphospho)-2-C-methyl-D-erythritol kinase [Pseudofrancisella aestuarii]